MEKTTNVDTYIKKHINHEDLLHKLRTIIQTTILNETIKWGMLTYTCDSKNLLGLGAFNKHVGVVVFSRDFTK